MPNLKKIVPGLRSVLAAAAAAWKEVRRDPPPRCDTCRERGACDYFDLPEHHFTCERCQREVPWCFGGADDEPEWCDDCWCDKHGRA